MASFEEFYRSAQENELILCDGGLCRFHLCKDGRLTIYEIIVLPAYQGKGLGKYLLGQLQQIKAATYILAKCPADLPSNKWYEKMGFKLDKISYTKTKRKMNTWIYILKKGLLTDEKG